ncbi:hypothetical protein NQZ68_000471 [Dissostichus eleginoides]|nr:hypothetical protein NQZ68_000471 [Dissostichus eleginoides]
MPLPNALPQSFIWREIICWVDFLIFIIVNPVFVTDQKPSIAPDWTAEALIESAIQLNFTNKVWIADEEWSLNKNLPKIKGIRNIGTVLEELKKSNFTLLNESIRFDENGDPNYGSYSVVFWNHSGDAEEIGFAQCEDECTTMY